MISSTSSPSLSIKSSHYAADLAGHLRPDFVLSRTGSVRSPVESTRMEAAERRICSSRDASTQYSPPKPSYPPQSPARGKRKSRSPSLEQQPRLPKSWNLAPQSPGALAAGCSQDGTGPISRSGSVSSKRFRSPEQDVKRMPARYELCNSPDLVRLISSMLMELIRFNDDIPLADGSLTRFHSRTPPSISVHDYLQRLATHATLSPPILLSMVFYIDRMCALFPTFTISSLTVHRFLIASATVASKGLSDSFWTNNTYARVGGVSLKELALLELEFLRRVEWRIVPQPEVLVDYYRSLIERTRGFEFEAQSP